MVTQSSGLKKRKFWIPTPSEPEKVEQKARHFYKIATQSDFLTITEIQKAIVRKRYSEAFPVYYQFIARNLAIFIEFEIPSCKSRFRFKIRLSGLC